MTRWMDTVLNIVFNQRVIWPEWRRHGGRNWAGSMVHQLFLVFHKTWRQTSTNWILLQRDDKWGLDKWKEEAHYSSPFKSGTHFQLCLFYRLWASPQIPCEFKCNFYVKPSKPNLNSKWWISKSVLHNNGQFTVTNSQLSSQGSNTEYPIWTTYIQI